jgi:dTDP-4-dehydrorhamnose 3,5-epimerase
MGKLISGVEIHPLREIADERGAVLHMLRNDASWFRGFGEIYFSEVKPGAVKAWKRHRVMTQHFAVPFGRIRLVVFDDRQESPSNGTVMTIEIGRPDAYQLVIVPPAVWYGFSAIGSTTALLANCADTPHDPGESEHCTIEEAQAMIPYEWKSA